MSNFQELVPMVAAQTVDAPMIFSASTIDTRTALNTPNYASDLVARRLCNANDLLYITYDTSSPTTKFSGWFYIDEVNASLGQYNLSRSTPSQRPTTVTYAGGAANFNIVIPGLNITTSSVVIGPSFTTQATASSILTARVSAADTVSFTTTANPGASTITLLLII